MTETAFTLIVGAQSMFAEGVMATLERGRHYVEQRSDTIYNLSLKDYAGSKKLLFVYVSFDKNDAVTINKEISIIRNHLPQAKIILLKDKTTIDIQTATEFDCDAFVQCLLDPQALLIVIELVFSMPCRLLVMNPGQPSGSNSERPMLPLDAANASPDAEALVISSLGRPLHLLSKREHEILSGLSRGEANKHIARNLDISEATVKAHVRSILQKLGAENRTQAAMKVLEGGRRSALLHSEISPRSSNIRP